MTQTNNKIVAIEQAVATICGQDYTAPTTKDGAGRINGQAARLTALEEKFQAVCEAKPYEKKSDGPTGISELDYRGSAFQALC